MRAKQTKEDAMKVGEVCNREVVVVNRDQSILDAAKLMRSFHVGDVVVVQDAGSVRTPVGILTDRDIVVKLLAREIDLAAVSIGDAMSFDLVTAGEEDSVIDAIEKMRNQGVRRIPVVSSQGGLEGILSLDDCLELVAEQVDDLVQLIKTEQRRENQELSFTD
jgi:CBS domain-containing protein